MDRLNSDWFIGVDAKKKEDFENTLKSLHSNSVLKQLKKIVNRRLEILESSEGSPTLYTEGYPYKQAHYNGVRESLKYVSLLLNFVDNPKE